MVCLYKDRLWLKKTLGKILHKYSTTNEQLMSDKVKIVNDKKKQTAEQWQTNEPSRSSQVEPM